MLIGMVFSAVLVLAVLGLAGLFHRLRRQGSGPRTTASNAPADRA